MEAEHETTHPDVMEMMEELQQSFSKAIPTLLHSVPVVRENPRIYNCSYHRFLSSFCYGGKHGLSLGHLLDLWIAGFLRDENCFFFGGAGGFSGCLLWGLDIAQLQSRIIIGEAMDMRYGSTSLIYGPGNNRIAKGPDSTVPAVSFPEALEWSATLQQHESPPDVIPLFIQQMAAEGKKPNLPVMDFVSVPSGTFLMGQSEKSYFCRTDFPGAPVLVDAFEMMTTPVTRGLFQEVTGCFPLNGGNPNLPVFHVTWHEAVAFSKLLSSLDRKYDYRLPTEAEWEYACTRGEPTISIPNQTILEDETGLGQRLLTVGIGEPNSSGLFDMGTQVREWCSNTFSPVYPDIRAGRNSMVGRGFRTLKGGMIDGFLRIPPTYSDKCVPWRCKENCFGTGFRLVRTPKKKEVQID